MKRGILILLFILILVSSVYAATTVTLTDPSDEVIIYNNGTLIDFTCNVGYITGEDNITGLFLHTNLTGWVTRENTTSISSGVDYSFEDIDVNDKANETYEWNCEVRLLEGDPVWAANNFTFNLSETPVEEAPNTAPSWEAIADWTISKDAYETPSTINLSANISDAQDDDTPLQISWSETNTSAVKVDSIDNATNVIQFSTITNKSGSNTVTLTLVDSDGLTSSESFTITVNSAPYLSDVIPNQTWDENTNETIALDDYFADIEDSDSSLTYSYTFTSSGTHINVTIESDGGAVFTPEDDWIGTETLTFTATDTYSETVTSNVVTLTVEEGTGDEDLMILTKSPSGVDVDMEVGESETFLITYQPSNVTVSWYVNGTLQTDETNNSFTYGPTKEGNYTIKVRINSGGLLDDHEWTLTVKTATTKTNKTAPPSEEEPEEETFVCGDEVCDEGETTTSCCKDCGCPSGWECEDNKCRKERKSGNIILLIIIITLFVGGAGAGIYFYKKKQEQEIFGLAKTPFRAPPKGGVQVKKEEVKQLQKPAVVKEPAKKPLKTAKTTNQVLLKKYILYNLKKGKTFNQIKKELLKVGWKEDQIQDAYTAAQLDEAFS